MDRVGEPVQGGQAGDVGAFRRDQAITAPEPSEILRAGDRLVVVCRHQDLGSFRATGVKVHDQVAGWGLPQGRGGRIQVEPDLRVVGHPEIFAVGDVAASVDGALPQLAQPAIQGGRHVAAQIRRLLAGQPTEPMVYKDKGTMATIGRSAAVVQLPRGVSSRAGST